MYTYTKVSPFGRRPSASSLCEGADVLLHKVKKTVSFYTVISQRVLSAR